MSHTYGSCLNHFVFSTAGRVNQIQPDWQPRLWDYIGGIANTNGITPICIGGTANHCHVLLQIPPRIAPAEAARLIKAGSSRWIHENIPHSSAFAWQTGYGVFSIGHSQIQATQTYIENQQEHHRAKLFEDEYRAILNHHQIQIDEKYWACYESSCWTRNSPQRGDVRSAHGVNRG